MTLRRLLCLGLPLVLIVAVGSCARDEGITGVATETQLEPDASFLGSWLGQTGLLSCTSLPPDADTASIGPEGGHLVLGPHVLYVPPGALAAPVTITGEIVPGSVNAVSLEPHGLAFSRPARLSMSYANCNLLGRLWPKRIAYVDESLNILEYLLSLDLPWLKRVNGRLDHFSSYAVSW